MSLWWDRHPALRRGPWREAAFGGSRVRSERTAAVLGIALGACFTVCFLTGLASHLIQHPPGWFSWPPRPAGLYRVTQGLHVATGIVSVPLLLAKLWAVYPKLWEWPPVTGVAHAVERASLVPLVGGGLFMVFTGSINIARWYDPLGFFFTAGHYWVAWVTMGALVVHVGAKAAITRRALSPGAGGEPDHAGGRRDPGAGGLSRRGFIAVVGATSGLLTVATVGQTVRPLRKLSVLAPRRPDIGIQGVPVNRSSAAAGVTEPALDPAYRLAVTGAVARPLSLSRADLEAMDQHEAVLPIACVEGWSASGRWRGVPVRDLLAAAGAAEGAQVVVESLELRGRYRTSVLDPGHAYDRDTLLALDLNGEPLHLEHGYPVRLIAPNRPGVLQTKWIARLVVR